MTGQHCPTRRAVVVMALGMTLTGCASLVPRSDDQRLNLERPGEALALARSGRFSARAVLAPGNERAAQGRFEWLELQSAGQRRQLLLLQGPLGHSAGSLERPLALTALDARQDGLMHEHVNGKSAREDAQPAPAGEVRVYDADGLRLDRRSQDQMLGALIGTSNAAALSDSQAQAWLNGLMDFFTSASAAAAGRVREATFELSQARLVMRLAMDEEAPR